MIILKLKKNVRERSMKNMDAKDKNDRSELTRHLLSSFRYAWLRLDLNDDIVQHTDSVRSSGTNDTQKYIFTTRVPDAGLGADGLDGTD